MSDRRWMLFVDGENLAIRAAKGAQHHAIALSEGENYKKDVFVWLPGLSATHGTARER